MIKSLGKKLVVGLEIGTTKVVLLVGEKHSDGVINIIGIGDCISKGMHKGNINNLELIIKCIKYAINKAEKMAKCQISSVYLSISGKYIHCQNEVGIIPISSKEVTIDDIENVLHTAKSVKIKEEHNILHVIPQEYSIDYQKRIKNPLGLSGIRMQAQVHLITCHKNMLKNILRAVEICQIKVDQIIFSGLASSFSVLKKDEIDLGVCLVDIGGGTMDISIYTDGSLRHTKVIPYAGNVVTNDIAYAFGSSLIQAEKIKIKYGAIIEENLYTNNNIENNNHHNKSLKKQILLKVITLRYKELLKLVNKEILKLKFNLKKQGVQYNLSSGIVLTGGASQISGLINCAKKIFNMKVRIGIPEKNQYITEHDLFKPLYSTVIGLLNYEKEKYWHNLLFLKKENIFINWIKKIKNWLKKEF